MDDEPNNMVRTVGLERVMSVLVTPLGGVTTICVLMVPQLPLTLSVTVNVAELVPLPVITYLDFVEMSTGLSKFKVMAVVAVQSYPEKKE